MNTDRPEHRLARLLLPLSLLALVVVGWQVAVSVFAVPRIVLPSPAEVLGSASRHGGTLAASAAATAGRVLAGFVLSVAIAIPLAVLVVQFGFMERAVYPLVSLSQTIPKVALAPLFVVWLGTGAVSQMAFAAMVAFFPIFIDTLVGLRAVPAEMLLLARSMGATTLQAFVKIRLPHALPNIFAGLKVGATLSVIGSIVAEWVGGDTGLALVLLRADALLDTALAFAALVLLAVLGMAFFALIRGLERVLSPARTAREQGEIVKTM
ncbi:MAG: ABC transporter permease [Elusimicrobia bacterium]|nr:ABC transporter permease [Elusimicrobiota bacterium]